MHLSNSLSLSNMHMGNMLLIAGSMLLLAPSLDAKAYHECTSVDIRNNCSKLHQLDNCTVVTGYVMITLITNPEENCSYSNYTFPLLTEITEYMIFTEVRGLTNITSMFPHLAVIRGRRLFLNYALGVTSMPDLEVVRTELT